MQVSRLQNQEMTLTQHDNLLSHNHINSILHGPVNLETPVFILISSFEPVIQSQTKDSITTSFIYMGP